MRKQNKGFTLIEVLVAMTILSIIVVPMLHGFVTAARTNAKAKNLLNANNLSQSIMEELKAGNLETLSTTYKEYDAEGHEVAFEAGKESYALQAEGVGAGSSGYDVQILLDENSSSEGKGLANILSMDRADCGYFVQKNNMDEKAAANFKLKNDTYFDAVAQKTASEFAGMMNRTITVELDIDAVTTAQCVEVTYTYEIPRGYTAEEDCIYTQSLEIYNNLVTEKELKAVYLYYYPRYGSGTDTLKILNTYNFEIPVYIIKMDRETPESLVPGTLEITPMIWVEESVQAYAAGNLSHVTICTNLEHPENLTSQNVRITDLGNAVDAVKLYDVTIHIYKQGDDAFTGDLLGTYTGSCMAGSR